MPERVSAPRVEFHPQAEAEFDAEFDRLRGIDPDIASDFEAEVRAGIRLVREHPPSGPAVGRSRNLRQKVLRRFRFTLIYSTEPDLIRVVALAHQSRRPGYWRHRVHTS